MTKDIESLCDNCPYRDDEDSYLECKAIYFNLDSPEEEYRRTVYSVHWKTLSARARYWSVLCPRCGYREDLDLRIDLENLADFPRERLPARCARCGAHDWLVGCRLPEGAE